MSVSAQRMRKKLEQRRKEAASKDIVPEHTDNGINGHHENDLIIIYSKYEDLLSTDIERDPTLIGKYVPQWFMTDCVSESRGISTTPNRPMLCDSYRQMEQYGCDSITRATKREIRKVLFYYSKCILKVSDVEPFSFK